MRTLDPLFLFWLVLLFISFGEANCLLLDGLMPWNGRGGILFMFTVFMKGNSLIFQSGFETWGQAELYGWDMFGPENFEIVQEW